jgi:NADP-dependent aldehyde dehydrogenase
VITSLDARTGAVVAEVAEETSEDEVGALCRRAGEVAPEMEALGRGGRAKMLSAMAATLEARRTEIVETADRETALGEARLGGELTRTCFQLRFMGEVITDGAYLEATIDHAGGTAMGPRPDLRRVLRPLGPVAVFGASNFPLAFSVPGGDTASALAAGCPVLAKVHPAHPATAVLCAEALMEGASAAGVDLPVISLVFGDTAGIQLVGHAAVKAVGFTGSLSGGRHLFELASRRPSPIPFYGELGALNAVVVAPGAAARRAEEIASGMAGSFSLGVGQFCTKPGLLLLPAGEVGERLSDALAEAVRPLQAGRMLSERIADAYGTGSEGLRSQPGVRVLAGGGAQGDGSGWWGAPLLLEATGASLDGPLAEECFGPVLVVVRYQGSAHLSQLLESLRPALTATLHAELPDDEAISRSVVEITSAKAGRLVWDGYPTGVAVAWAMHHGGPYPATTDPLHTSVGAAAVRRWLRPVCYQNFPQAMLPPELRDDPGRDNAVVRRVDGKLVLP